MKPAGEQPLIGGQEEIAAIVEAVRAGRCCRFIGPRYHHKSRIMRRARERVRDLLGHACLYVSLWETTAVSLPAFYSSIRDLIAKDALDQCRRRLARPKVKTAAELTAFLAGLPASLRANVVLFMDDLEVAPPEYLDELLIALRAAYQTTTTRLRFAAVICASNSLARTALGPTSPFENIASLVSVRDLNAADTHRLARQLLAVCGPNPTAGALKLIYDQTSGDRLLVGEVCQACCRLVASKQAQRVTRDVVRIALDNVVQHAAHGALAEGLHHIQNDQNLLRAILLLMRQGEAAAAELLFDPSERPDPLTISGFVARRGSRYLIKSELHHQVLERFFSAEHVGRIAMTAGDWEQAIRYLGHSLHPKTADERAQIMLAAVSAMYQAEDKRGAYAFLAQGLETAYRGYALRLYDCDAHKKALVAVHPAPANAQAAAIPWRASNRAEVKALNALPEYWWQPDGRRRSRLFVPLREKQTDRLGLAVFEDFATQQTFRRRQDQISELVGYLRHAARALRNREAYARLQRTAERRSKDFEHLLKLTRELMSTHGAFQQVLDEALSRALAALGRQAQRGSIYLLDRQTEKLVMRAGCGYPTQDKPAAQFAPGQGLAGYVYKTGRPWIVRDTATDPHFEVLGLKGTTVRSCIGVPLIGHSGTLGVLCLDNSRRTEAFNHDSQQLLTLFANLVAPWLENARLLEVQARRQEVATSASQLFHEVELSGLGDWLDVFAREIECLGNPKTLLKPLSYVQDIAEAAPHISAWLRKFVRTGDLSLEIANIVELAREAQQRAEKHRLPHVHLGALHAQPDSFPVRVDCELIRVLIHNLLKNAYHELGAAPAGEVSWQIYAERNECVIRVLDNGPGIPPEHRARIWEPGFSTKSAGDGGGHRGGYGLSLCLGIARAHGGTIRYDQDSPAGGACFTVRLPVLGPEAWLEG